MSHAFRCVAAALLAATPSLLTAQQKPVSAPPPSAAALTALVDSVVRARLLTQGVPAVSVTVVRGDESALDAFASTFHIAPLITQGSMT